MIGEEFEAFPFADELLFVIGGLGGLFKIPFGISFDGVPPLLVLDSVEDVFKLFEVDDDVVVMVSFALLPLLLLLLKVDKLRFVDIAGELFELLKLFAFDSILK